MRTTLFTFIAGFLACCLLFCANANAQFTLSGQLRTRTELLHGQGSPLSKNDKAAFFTSQRTRLNAGYTGYRMQFFTAIQDVRVWGQDASTNNRIASQNLNGLMLHEAWAQISLLDTGQANVGKTLALKIGRQELLYDDSRLLGNLDWLQQARRHDAVLLKYENKNWTAHIGAAYNQNREVRSGTLYDGVPVGYPAGTNAIGTMYKSMQFVYFGKKTKTGKASFLIFKDDFQKYSKDSIGKKELKDGTWNRITVGPYFETKLGKYWNLVANAYYQTGKDKDGLSLDAYLYSVRGLYNANSRFAVGPGFDYTSGSQAGSAKNHTFDPLYGTPHKFWGQMDYFYAANGFGRGGLKDFYINTLIKPGKKWLIQGDLHQFSSAAPIRNSENQKLSANFGSELDIIATYSLTNAISFQAGYCTFLPSSSLAVVKNISNPQKMANWAYLMINIKPDFIK
ncbi:alginate export family protein [Dyadobacter crusticola]|uniref:alginate export family protein n=1 Tax=Dyadobacter crusticola TaxID=292407 RepID=UPI0004E243E6|nr:alginate export family protein [Dyadobacter crusticola]